MLGRNSINKRLNYDLLAIAPFTLTGCYRLVLSPLSKVDLLSWISTASLLPTLDEASRACDFKALVYELSTNTDLAREKRVSPFHSIDKTNTQQTN
jgi:hypothetical protein